MLKTYTYKFLTFGLLVSFAFTTQSCRKDDPVTETEISVTTQNEYDNAAAQKFLNDNYFDPKGNIVEFSSTDPADDNYPKLSSYNPVTLPSGVIYIVREGAQANPGEDILPDDILRLMHKTVTYKAIDDKGVKKFDSPIMFRNTIASTGVPDVDPAIYYVKDNIITANPTKTRAYYEIEGFKEGLQHFKAFNIPDSDDYNLQGVIIVPSRAAFARDDHFNYVGVSLKDRSFVFNFQVYKRSPR